MPDIIKNKIEPRVEIMNLDEETSKVYLYGIIRKKTWFDNDESEFISAKRVKNILDKTKGKDLTIHMNSNGGDVYESIAISNLIKDYDGKVDIYIDAMAASGASIIATAADNVYMYINSQQMIHKAWTFASGNSDDLKKISNDLEKIDDSVSSSYMKRFVGEKEDLIKLIEQETYLTAEECLELGLCDQVIDLDEDDEEEETQNNIKEKILNKYKGNVANKIRNSKKVNNNDENQEKSLFKNFRR